MFDMATSYQLTCINKSRYKDDRERSLRFYKPRTINLDTKAHRCSFKVWQRSLSLRYAIEAFIFLIVMLVF